MICFLKVALGPKYLALNVTDEEIDTVLRELGQNVGDKVRDDNYQHTYDYLKSSANRSA